MQVMAQILSMELGAFHKLNAPPCRTRNPTSPALFCAHLLLPLKANHCPNLPQHRMSSLSFNLYVSGPYTIGNFLHLAPLSQAL